MLTLILHKTNNVRTNLYNFNTVPHMQAVLKTKVWFIVLFVYLWGSHSRLQAALHVTFSIKRSQPVFMFLLFPFMNMILPPNIILCIIVNFVSQCSYLGCAFPSEYIMSKFNIFFYNTWCHYCNVTLPSYD